jgi:hypothetical protein
MAGKQLISEVSWQVWTILEPSAYLRSSQSHQVESAFQNPITSSLGSTISDAAGKLPCIVSRTIPILLWSEAFGIGQGGGEQRKLFSEKTEKTRRNRKRKVFCSFF